MMKELKFRQFLDGEFWYWGYGVIPGDNTFVHPIDHRKPSEQYIGVKDKNGIKIYAGDILKYVSPTPELGDTDETYQVEWIGHGFTAKWLQAKKGWNQYPENCLLDTEDDMEIIGNIHESPELLK